MNCPNVSFSDHHGDCNYRSGALRFTGNLITEMWRSQLKDELAANQIRTSEKMQAMSNCNFLVLRIRRVCRGSGRQSQEKLALRMLSDK